MSKQDALKLHNEDEVIVNETGEVTTVLKAYEEEGNVYVETTYHGFTKFFADEIK